MTQQALGRPSVALPYRDTAPPWVTHLTEHLVDRIDWLTTFFGILATLAAVTVTATALKAALIHAVRRRQRVEPSRPPQRRPCVVCLAESRRHPAGLLQWPALTAVAGHPLCGRPSCYLILVVIPSAAGFPRR
jgi:hypothetical protein